MFNRSLALKVYPFDTRLTAMPPPTAGVFDYPTVQICLNAEWASHVMGAIERLAWEDAWEGDDETIYLAIQGVENILASFSIGGGCCCLPPGTLTRVSADGVLQVSSDGGETWRDAPELDPRITSIQFPPLPEVSGSTACAGAQNARQQLETWVDEVADVIDAGGGLTALVAAITAIAAIFLSGGALAPLVVGLAAAVITAGASALRAAFDPTALDIFECCVFQNIASDASFASVDDLLACIASDMSGLSQVVAYAIVTMLGSIGMTNWARTGSASGEGCCDVCEEGCTTGVNDLSGLFTSLPAGYSFTTTGGGVIVDSNNIGFTSAGTVVLHFPEQCVVQVSTIVDVNPGHEGHITVGSTVADYDGTNDGTQSVTPPVPVRIDHITFTGDDGFNANFNGLYLTTCDEV